MGLRRAHAHTTVQRYVMTNTVATTITNHNISADFHGEPLLFHRGAPLTCPAPLRWRSGLWVSFWISPCRAQPSAADNFCQRRSRSYTA